MRIYSDELATRTDLPPSQVDQIYNAMDSAMTLEVYRSIAPQLRGNSAVDTYNFTLAMRAPALDMMLRGVRVNLGLANERREEIAMRLHRLDHTIGQLTAPILGAPLNANSPKQLQRFFYEALGLPEQHRFDKGVRKVSTNREALENLALFAIARPVANCIMRYKDLFGLMKVLRKGIDPDGRIRTSYNITGTETGRWSSSTNAFGRGDNLQNWTGEMRQILCADPGYKVAYIDLQSAESYAVAYLSGDEDYIAACHSGDIHTYVARMVWPALAWTGDLASDRKIADGLFYGHMTRRDLSKRGGHGTNYYGKPPTIARHMKVPTMLIRSFQDQYFERFPGIRAWHQRVAQELQTTFTLTTPFGRTRQFLGRTWEDATLREAIAFNPQSFVGDYLNHGLLSVYRARLPSVQLLLQIHDAIGIQYKPEHEAEVLPAVQRLMSFPVEIGGRSLTIPTDVEVGWNFGKFHPEKNPDGLRKWRGTDDRERQEYPRPAPPIMDRRFL